MASYLGTNLGQSTKALEDLLLQNHLIPTPEQISHCEEALKLLCCTILGDHFHNVPGSNPTVYTSTVDGVVLVLAPSGSYGLGAWDPSAVIPCSIAGTPSGNTFFDLARQRIHRATNLGVVLLKADNHNDDAVFEVDIKGVRFCFQYFQSSYAKTWSTQNITGLLRSNVSISSTALFEVFNDTMQLKHTIRDIVTFSSSLRFAKLWALHRGLISSRFGYLDDRTIMLMIARVFFLEEPGHSHTVQSVMKAFFNYLSRPDYKAGTRGLWVPSISGAKNVSNVKSKSVLEWLSTELQVSANHMDNTIDWSWSSLVGDQFQERSLQFLTKEPYYIQLDVSHWGASPSLGAKYFDWIDLKVSSFYKDLCDFYPECYPRVWPVKFIDPSETDLSPTPAHYEGYRAFYVIHMRAPNNRSAPKSSGEHPGYNDIANGLDSRVSRFLDRIHEDENFDKECCLFEFSMHTTLLNHAANCTIDTKGWGLIPCEETKSRDDNDDFDTKPVPKESEQPLMFREAFISHSLRPAHEVLERLRWDSAYDICKYMIGYKDRHEGLMEMPAENWMRRAKFEEKDWIPESRIQYFKEKGSDIRVWDRATKTDLVFCSTNS